MGVEEGGRSGGVARKSGKDWWREEVVSRRDTAEWLGRGGKRGERHC